MHRDDGAAPAPDTPGSRPGRPVDRTAIGQAGSARNVKQVRAVQPVTAVRQVKHGFGRLMEDGLLLQGGVQGSPVLRLFTRWVRRPLLPAARLWRRNIQ